MFDPNRIQDDLLELQKRLGRVEARVDELELNQSGKPGRKPDEVTIKIVEFLKANAGLKLNSGSIAGNIGVETKIVSGRLKTLFGRGVIKAEKLTDLSAMYWYESKDEEN